MVNVMVITTCGSLVYAVNCKLIEFVVITFGCDSNLCDVELFNIFLPLCPEPFA